MIDGYAGFTPYYTAVNWYGYDQNESIYFEGKKNPAGIMWANIMARIHTKLNNASFEKPSWINEITICADTGKKAVAGCTDTYTEYFLSKTEPEECNKHSKTSSGGSGSNNRTRRTTNSFDTTTSDDVDNPVKENKTKENKTTTDSSSDNTKTTTDTSQEKNTINTNSNLNTDTDSSDSIQQQPTTEPSTRNESTETQTIENETSE